MININKVLQNDKIEEKLSENENSTLVKKTDEIKNEKSEKIGKCTFFNSIRKTTCGKNVSDGGTLCKTHKRYTYRPIGQRNCDSEEDKSLEVKNKNTKNENVKNEKIQNRFDPITDIDIRQNSNVLSAIKTKKKRIVEDIPESSNSKLSLKSTKKGLFGTQLAAYFLIEKTSKKMNIDMTGLTEDLKEDKSEMEELYEMLYDQYGPETCEKILSPVILWSILSGMQISERYIKNKRRTDDQIHN